MWCVGYVSVVRTPISAIMDRQQHQMQGEHQMLPPISEAQLAPPGFGPPGTQGWANDVYIGK